MTKKNERFCYCHSEVWRHNATPAPNRQSNFTYPEENEFMNNQVFSIPCFKWIRGWSQRGLGMRLKAYGPASGGFVWYLNELGGPISVRIVEYCDSKFLFEISFCDGLNAIWSWPGNGFKFRADSWKVSAIVLGGKFQGNSTKKWKYERTNSFELQFYDRSLHQTILCTLNWRSHQISTTRESFSWLWLSLRSRWTIDHRLGQFPRHHRIDSYMQSLCSDALVGEN